jgi:hypothetical protein
MSLIASAVALAFCLAAGAAAQEPLSLEHFDGWEMWPLVEPGDLHPDNAGLVPIRIELDGLFPGPNGFGVPPLEGLTMYMDVTESSFHGNPALWVQWTSKPPPGSPGAPALDVLLVDRETFRLLFRIAGSARGDWAGRYELIQAPPDRVVQVTVGEDGETTKNVLASSASHFDFAAYPFLLPFLDLREGMGWRLSGYDYLEKKGEVLAVRVVGRTSLTDADGVEHDVWQVDVMPAHSATLISFYVSEKPPYFYGWDYRLTRDGSTALKLTLRGWTPMAIG